MLLLEKKKQEKVTMDDHVRYKVQVSKKKSFEANAAPVKSHSTPGARVLSCVNSPDSWPLCDRVTILSSHITSTQIHSCPKINACLLLMILWPQ